MQNDLKKLAQQISENLLIDQIAELVDYLMIEGDIKRTRLFKAVKKDREITLDKNTTIHPVCKS